MRDSQQGEHNRSTTAFRVVSRAAFPSCLRRFRLCCGGLLYCWVFFSFLPRAAGSQASLRSVICSSPYWRDCSFTMILAPGVLCFCRRQLAVLSPLSDTPWLSGFLRPSPFFSNAFFCGQLSSLCTMKTEMLACVHCLLFPENFAAFHVGKEGLVRPIDSKLRRAHSFPPPPFELSRVAQARASGF